MTADQLKNSILQQAVQGKLVPQDPEDEPASALLGRIRAEKDQLIKEGKIKRDKHESTIYRRDGSYYENVDGKEHCIDDEILFDIPQNWEWVRLNNLFCVEMGQSPKGECVSNKVEGIEFHQGKIFFGSKYLKKSDQVTTNPTKIAPAGSVLLCVRAPVGKVNITDREICIGRGLCSITPLCNMNVDFVFYLMEAYENIFVKQSTGTTFRAITGNVVKNQLIPIPPFQEQFRIVEKINKLSPFVTQYDTLEQKNDQLITQFPEQLKKSILQQAVQGKFVPQDPDDEPASVLLERIRAEKDQLIKEGKIKRDKHASTIYRRDGSYYEKVDNKEYRVDDEIPFEIPDSWEWARLKNICHIINGDRGKNYPSKNSLSPSGIPFISALNLDGKSIISDENLLCLTEEQYNKLGNGKLHKDDIVVCIRGSLGKHGRYPYEKGAIASSLVILRPIISNEAILSYILLYLDSPVFYQEIKIYDNGTAQPNLAAKDLGQFLFPLPPLKEQIRIVNKTDIILSQFKNF